MSGKNLFIQIPCLNEEKTLTAVISDLPRKIEGVERIYTLVIDDGSADGTFLKAKELGVDFIVRNHRNMGLAKSFSKGLDACLYLGADIIVNTDGDHQYRGDDIPRLIKPIIDNTADIVIGCRDNDHNTEFSWLKKILQKVGSCVVRILSGTDVPDTTSGFRALSRSAAMRMSFMSDFSYTLEMLVQAGHTGLNVQWFPILTNRKLRESRLFKSIPAFLYQQIKTLIAAFLFYRPMQFFGTVSIVFFSISLLVGLRIAYFLWFIDPSFIRFKSGSSLIFLFTSGAGILFLIAGLIGAVLSGLRFLAIDIRNRIRNDELSRNVPLPDMDLWINDRVQNMYSLVSKSSIPKDLSTKYAS